MHVRQVNEGAAVFVDRTCSAVETIGEIDLFPIGDGPVSPLLCPALRTDGVGDRSISIVAVLPGEQKTTQTIDNPFGTRVSPMS
ncbi:MAG: hypothetical protein D6782_00945 [Alphaproteobacteria bacterium]|nr:MAG: hypothetical protein D6782_00945 [Alphaproteobacteria bacterium]